MYGMHPLGGECFVAFFADSTLKRAPKNLTAEIAEHAEE
jgi:hypothetical protein